VKTQDKTSVEAPAEAAEVARQMFGADHTVGGQETVFDVGEHGVRPAEGGMARGRAIGAGNVALMDETRLFGERTGEGAGRGRRGHTPFIMAVETSADGRPLYARLQVVRGFQSGETKRLCGRVADGFRMASRRRRDDVVAAASASHGPAQAEASAKRGGAHMVTYGKSAHAGCPSGAVRSPITGFPVSAFIPAQAGRRDRPRVR